MTRGRYITVLLILAFLLGSPSTGQEYDRSILVQVKAAFLFNFTKFVVWPEDSFEGPKAPFRIGVLDNDDVVKHLRNITEGETVRGRTVIVEEIRTLDDPVPCHVLFVGAPSEADVPSLTELEKHPVLVVGESPEFASRSGIVNFVLNGSRLGLEINPLAAEDAGLQVNSRLLSLATLVADGDATPLH